MSGQAAEVIRYGTAKIGIREGRPRVFVWGRYLERAGISPALRIRADYAAGRVLLRFGESGEKAVHQKGGKPVVDINSRRLREAFGEAECVQVKLFDRRIELTLPRVAVRRAGRCRNGREGSVFAGGGLLTKAAQLAGLEPAWAIERDPRYAETYERNFPRSRMYNLCISQVPMDELEEVEGVTVGLPCEGFSPARTTERGTKRKRDRTLPPEAHESGDMALYLGALLHRIKPSFVVVEEARTFLSSATSYMLHSFLRREGYAVESRVVEPSDYNFLQNRRRAVLVAHSGDFDWNMIEPRAGGPLRVGEILDPPAAVESGWFTFEERAWMRERLERHAALGNNFAPHVLTAESATVPALKKFYLNFNYSDVPMLRHPQEPGKFRYLTLREVRRLFCVPDDFILPQESRCLSGEVLCQGVIVDLFRRIISAASGRTRAVAETFLHAGEAAGQLALAFLETGGRRKVV